MEDKKEKLGFFSRVRIAVTKLENYGIFLEEKTSIAVKYFFLIVLVLAICMATVETYSFMKIVSKGYTYIKNELPDFSYTNGNLEFSKNVQSYDSEFDLYMIADTSSDLSGETLKEYKNNIKSIGIIFLKDKAVYLYGNNEVEYVYTDLSKEYGIDNIDRQGLIEKIDSIGMIGIATTIFIMLLIGLYILQLFSIFMDWIIISIFAFVVARICKINMTYKHVWNISIYALTFPIILTIIYNVAYYLIGFYTDYFRMVYLLISYIYVVAVILMIKSDLIRQQIEVQKIIEVQKQVHEELKEDNNKDEQKEPKDEESDENKIDDLGNQEPDGSEI